MPWHPIAHTLPQYVDSSGDAYSGAVLKAYSNGTSTNISMATDATGGTTATSMALNTQGYPEVSGNMVIPHVHESYKLSLYATQAAADADTGAIWTIDELTAGPIYSEQYFTDTGFGDAHAITPSPPIPAYAAGQTFRFKSTGASTGASTLNVNSLGAQDLTRDGSTPLIAGDIAAGAIVTATYDGTQFQVSASPMAIATQAQMETATSTGVIVTPGRAHFHPSAAKAWGSISVADSVPSLDTNYNVSSITDTGTGDVAITIDTDLSSANYAITLGFDRTSSLVAYATWTGRSAGGFSIQHFAATATGDTTNVAFEPDFYTFAVHGDI